MLCPCFCAGTVILAGYYNACGFMGIRWPISLVDVLPAGAGSPERIDLQVSKGLSAHPPLPFQEALQP